MKNRTPVEVVFCKAIRSICRIYKSVPEPDEHLDGCFQRLQDHVIELASRIRSLEDENASFRASFEKIQQEMLNLNTKPLS